ncbi:MAG TPA: DUF6222 family protein [Pseudonocardiaceae bacterium]|jgi:hypothetical protein|nr:DUF6222 family protein [Pseudonocardiaceae bacterium]
MKKERALTPVESTPQSTSTTEASHDERSDSYQLHEDDVFGDYEPPVGSMPRLYRGVIWSDVVAEINADREQREAA